MLIVTHYFKDVHSVNKSIYFCFYKFLPELSQHYQRVLPLSVPMSNEVHTPESHMEQSFLKIRIVEWSQLSCFSISSLKLHNIHGYPNENNIFELLINLFYTITFHSKVFMEKQIQKIKKSLVKIDQSKWNLNFITHVSIVLFEFDL